MPQRPARGELHPRRRPALDRRLGVRGHGRSAFDLANFAVNNGLDEDGDRELLAAYGGGDLETHVLMRYMSDFREAMWGVVQQAVSEIEFDFAGYAYEHFARLERAAAEPRFRQALQ